VVRQLGSQVGAQDSHECSRGLRSRVLPGDVPMIGRGTRPSGRVVHAAGGRGEEQASGDRRRPAMPAPLVPCRESSRWVINRFTAVEFTWRWDVDVGGPLGEFLVGHVPSRV
jgi:hypothetical protein